MAKKVFRPQITDQLEDRAVPSGFGLFGSGGRGDFEFDPFVAGLHTSQFNTSSLSGPGGGDFGGGHGRGIFGGFGGYEGREGGFGEGFGGYGGLNISVPSQDAQAVHKAIQTFEQSYANDVNTILLSSTGTPTSNRAAFDAQVATDLQTLNTAIDAAIKNLPDAATLDTTIQNELLTPATTTGTATGTTTATATSLQAQLAAIATPTTTNWWTGRSYLRQSFWAIGDTASQIEQQVSSATPPTGSITNTTAQTLVSSVKTAFQTFTQGYANAVTTTPPSTSRTAFDNAVSTLVSTLNTSIQSAVTAANLPAATTGSLSTLATRLTADIVTPTTGATGASLQEKLAALTTPASSTGWPEYLFQAFSNHTIRRSQNQVITDIISALSSYNSTL